MPEFEFDPESVARAESLSSHLIQDLHQVSKEEPPFGRRELFSERRYADQAEGVPVNDVVVNIRQMATEFAMARQWDGKIICLKIGKGELAPISLSQLFGGPLSPFGGSIVMMELWARYFPFPPSQLWRDLQNRWSREEETVVVDVREAEKRLEGNLRSFLSYRFAGAKEWAESFYETAGSRDQAGRIRGDDDSLPPSSGPAASPGGGLHVQVSCRTPGLRLHISPSYFITWTYFGSPTTPVTSYVLPGRYVFAADGPMLPQWIQDSAIFSIPPTYRPALISF